MEQGGKVMNLDKESERLKLVRENLILSEKNDSFRMIHGSEYADWEDKMYICERLYSLDAMMSIGLYSVCLEFRDEFF